MPQNYGTVKCIIWSTFGFNVWRAGQMRHHDLGVLSSGIFVTKKKPTRADPSSRGALLCVCMACVVCGVCVECVVCVCFGWSVWCVWCACVVCGVCVECGVCDVWCVCVCMVCVACMCVVCVVCVACVCAVCCVVCVCVCMSLSVIQVQQHLMWVSRKRSDWGRK